MKQLSANDKEEIYTLASKARKDFSGTEKLIKAKIQNLVKNETHEDQLLIMSDFIAFARAKAGRKPNEVLAAIRAARVFVTVPEFYLNCSTAIWGDKSNSNPNPEMLLKLLDIKQRLNVVNNPVNVETAKHQTTFNVKIPAIEIRDNPNQAAETIQLQVVPNDMDPQIPRAAIPIATATPVPTAAPERPVASKKASLLARIIRFFVNIARVFAGMINKMYDYLLGTNAVVKTDAAKNIQPPAMPEQQPTAIVEIKEPEIKVAPILENKPAMPTINATAAIMQEPVENINRRSIKVAPAPESPQQVPAEADPKKVKIPIGQRVLKKVVKVFQPSKIAARLHLTKGSKKDKSKVTDPTQKQKKTKG